MFLVFLARLIQSWMFSWLCLSQSTPYYQSRRSVGVLRFCWLLIVGLMNVSYLRELWQFCRFKAEVTRFRAGSLIALKLAFSVFDRTFRAWRSVMSIFSFWWADCEGLSRHWLCYWNQQQFFAFLWFFGSRYLIRVSVGLTCGFEWWSVAHRITVLLTLWDFTFSSEVLVATITLQFVSTHYIKRRGAWHLPLWFWWQISIRVLKALNS